MNPVFNMLPALMELGLKITLLSSCCSSLLTRCLISGVSVVLLLVNLGLLLENLVLKRVYFLL